MNASAVEIPGWLVFGFCVATIFFSAMLATILIMVMTTLTAVKRLMNQLGTGSTWSISKPWSDMSNKLASIENAAIKVASAVEHLVEKSK